MRWRKPLLEHGKSGQVGVATFFNFNDDFLQLVAHVNDRRSVEPPSWPIFCELHCRFLLVGLRSFGIFIANQASRRTHQATTETADLFREAHEILAGVNVLEPNISRTGATRVYARLQAFQNERRDQKWTKVRVIQNKKFVLISGRRPRPLSAAWRFTYRWVRRRRSLL